MCDAQGKKTDHWCKAKIQLTTESILDLPDGEAWLKPVKWNQGGYDVIFVDKNQGYVRFVQITRGNRHSLRIEFFYDFLKRLQESDQSFEIKKLEIVFLLPEAKLQDFKISRVTGQGLLNAFSGWECGKEKDQVLVLGMKGL